MKTHLRPKLFFPAPGLSRAVLLGVGLACSVACSSGDDNLDSFLVTTATGSVQPASPITVVGRWAVYMVDEATTGAGGTDLNGDGDVADSVAHVVDLLAGGVKNLGAAARRAAVIGNSIYLAVDEATDGVDWNGDTLLDARVLLRSPATAVNLVYIDDLDPIASPEFVVSGSRLWYANTAAPALGNTTLQRIDAADPILPIPVPTASGDAQVTARPFGEEAGVLFVALDETTDSVDLNGDADQNDATVLALTLSAAAAPRVRNTGLALASTATPVRARATSSSERLVAFLVNEASHGTSFNDPTLFGVGWLPAQCPGNADVDTVDEVLHHLRFSLWDADPATNPPVNTGIAGESRVLLVNDFVATLARESHQGAGCDFNNDGDSTDLVLRWVGTGSPVLPENSVPLNRAVASVAGGAFGASELEGRFVAVLSESGNGIDLNGDNDQTDNILGWARPGSSGSWTVQHFDPSGPARFVGTTFLAREQANSALGVGFLEGTNNENLNRGCTGVLKDADTTDVLPVWVRFNSSNQLIVNGTGFALETGNTGIVVFGGRVYFRVSEAADNVDYNNDGQLDAAILMRIPQGACEPVAMSVLNSVAVPSIVTSNGATGAVFLCDEAQADLDLNGDGDQSDFVLRYFRF